MVCVVTLQYVVLAHNGEECSWITAATILPVVQPSANNGMWYSASHHKFDQLQAHGDALAISYFQI